jgi:DNA helicase II / ATP-dependent DNA helicase PcrA
VSYSNPASAGGAVAHPAGRDGLAGEALTSESSDRLSPRNSPAGPGDQRSALLNGLTDEQRTVVCHGAGPMRVLAPPGTGKTEVLARRVGYLIEQRVARPRQIVAMTFTTRAADEMRVRLTDLVGPRTAKLVTVCTIHSLCRRIISSHASEFGRKADYEIYDPATFTRLARAALADPANEALDAEHERLGAPRVEDLLAEISRAKNLLWSIKHYREVSEHPAAALIADLWTQLEAKMRESNAFDFDDLLVFTAQLLGTNETLHAYYRERYRWMMIDEFQDVNFAQMEIARQLMAPGGNLTVFGDDDQSLYAFRGADASNVLNFTADFPDAVTVTLSENFRSRKEILDVALRLIAHNKVRIHKPLKAVLGPGGWIGVRHYNTDEEEAREVADLIDTAIAGGRDPTEILVLARNIKPLRHLQQRLTARAIKTRLVGGQSLWERSEIRDAIAYLTVLANPYDDAAFYRSVTAPRDTKPFSNGNVKPPKRGIDKGVREIIAFAERNGLDRIEATLCCREIPGVRSGARAPLLEYAQGIDAARRASWSSAPSRPSVASLVDRTLRMPGGVIPAYEMLRDNARNRGVGEDAARVLEDLRSLIRSANRYDQTAGEEEPTIIGFLETLGLESAQELDAEHDDRLTLSTIHSAKGTQAVIVIVIAVEEDLLPDYRANDTVALEQERKLFYTAITRGAEFVWVIHTSSREGAATSGPSGLLPEAGLRG